MAERVKKIMLWRRDVDDRAGSLARVLEPLAGGGDQPPGRDGVPVPGAGGPGGHRGAPR